MQLNSLIDRPGLRAIDRVPKTVGAVHLREMARVVEMEPDQVWQAKGADLYQPV